MQRNLQIELLLDDRHQHIDADPDLRSDGVLRGAVEALDLWTGRCVGLAWLSTGKKYRAASAKRAEMGAFERIMILEARSARASPTLTSGRQEGK